MIPAVNIPSMSSPSSSRSTSMSSAPSSPKKLRMPYTPTSAMSTSAFYINDDWGAGAPVVQTDRMDSNSVPRVSGASRKAKKELFVEVPKKRVDVEEMPSVLPSPPLTRVGTNESRSTRGALPEDEEKEEVDITAWRASTQRAEEEDGDAYPDDSPESPVRDPSTLPTKDPLQALRVTVEPNAPSPPLWEVISPPSSNNHHSRTASRHELPDPLEARYVLILIELVKLTFLCIKVLPSDSSPNHRTTTGRLRLTQRTGLSR